MPEELAGAGSSISRVCKVAITVNPQSRRLDTLKWALENEVPAGAVLYIIYVQPPIRWIPNELGSTFSVEQVNPAIRDRYKNYLFSETEKLLEPYRRVCDTKQVQAHVLHSESDSVKDAIVALLYRESITKLILGISSRTVISRALNKDKITSFVLRHSPSFCTVLVVKKGLVCLSKNATNDPCVHGSSETDSRMATLSGAVIASTNTFEVEPYASTAIGDDEGGRASCRVLEDISNLQKISSNRFVTKVADKVPESKESPISCIALNSVNSASITYERTLHPMFDDPNQISLMSPENIALAINLLQEQLLEARQSAISAQLEAEQEKRKANELVATAYEKAMEHEKHWINAFREASRATRQAARDANRYNEALVALEQAVQDHEKDKIRLAEEVCNHQKTQAELELLKETVKAYAHEIACAKIQAESERKSNKEMKIRVDCIARRLENACQLHRQEAKTEIVAPMTTGNHKGGYLEYSFQDLQNATDGFSEQNKLGEGQHGPMYKGKVHHILYAIKVLAEDRSDASEYFYKTVEVLSHLRHPHVLALLGTCPERCIMYEFMVNGNLEDRLHCRNGSTPLPWQTRLRVCLEVATALLFLHSRVKPIVHGDLKLANILLDHHFVSKVTNIRLSDPLCDKLTLNVVHENGSKPVGHSHCFTLNSQCICVGSFEDDISALGVIMLQLLTRKPGIGLPDLVREAVGRGELVKLLDTSAGDWPLEAVTKLADIALQCITSSSLKDLRLETDILPVLESIQNFVNIPGTDICSRRMTLPNTHLCIPSSFFCPIYKDIMEEPCFAADGFTYENDAIRVWLQTNNTSPMTNKRLEHKIITPNYALRSEIKQWRDKGLI
ncbi:hypothetical protein KP509_1Z070800 [Ceratopteris richardii]|nr:hypothetical protein KP509_1Z070800 [Ceratopteris richardii]KAH6558290.1 hypothetical protein KP509_1Z070800 [Ceratopteris richardii]